MTQCSLEGQRKVLNPDTAIEVLSHSPNGIIITDKNLNINFMNCSAEKLLNKSFDEVKGECLKCIFPKFISVEAIDGNENKIYSEKIGKAELHLRAYKIFRDNHDLESVVIVILDLEETIKLSLQLAETKYMNQELKEILEGSYDGVLVTDGDGNILYVNQSYERITAIKRSDMEGKNMRDLINPVWMENSVAFVVTEQRQAVSKRQITKEGKNIIVTGMPVFDKKGKIKKIVINARDITEIYKLREELIKSKERESLYFKNMMDCMEEDHFKEDQIIAVSDKMRKVLSMASRIGNFNTTVLILGESGVGKEEVAKHIHKNSLRKDKSFITINCGAIPDNLLESELFGYEKGAFTGAATEGKIGLLEAADNGTVFLDEIGEISLDFQVKLLRVLETKEITRVGSVKPKAINVRFIAATNKNLEKMVEEESFREDLYYRLNVVRINVPPLRKRKQDIGPLAMFFIKKFNKKYDQHKILTMDIIKELAEYCWQGNVRELKNLIESMVVMSPNDYLQTEDLPWNSNPEKNISKKMMDVVLDNEDLSLEKALEQVEKLYLSNAKEKYRTTRAMAKHLKIDQSTIVRKLKKYGLN